MDLDDLEIKHPKCLLSVLVVGLVIEISTIIFYL